MVASAVKGLMPEKVVLVDYRGKILSRNGGPESGLSAQQLDARQRVETELAGKIVQILEPAVGQGKIRPQVSIVMNFEQVEETVEQYDPQHSVIRSEQKLQERSDVVKQNETINYEVSKAVRHVVNPVGKIEQVSVAVVIDNHTKVTTGSDGEEQTSQEPRTPEEMKKYRDLVTAAIGFNPDRGDQLTVENISFQGETELIDKPGFLEKQAPMIMISLRYLIIPVVFIILYLLFLRPVQKTVFANWAAAPTPRSLPLLPANLQTPMTVKQLEAQLSGASPYGNGDRDLMTPSGPSKMEMIRKRVVEHAQSDPETVARLVRAWLADEKNK